MKLTGLIIKMFLKAENSVGMNHFYDWHTDTNLQHSLKTFYYI